jgi:DnaK suppressor protein
MAVKKTTKQPSSKAAGTKPAAAKPAASSKSAAKTKATAAKETAKPAAKSNKPAPKAAKPAKPAAKPAPSAPKTAKAAKGAASLSLVKKQSTPSKPSEAKKSAPAPKDAPKAQTAPSPKSKAAAKESPKAPASAKAPAAKATAPASKAKTPPKTPAKTPETPKAPAKQPAKPVAEKAAKAPAAVPAPVKAEPAPAPVPKTKAAPAPTRRTSSFGFEIPAPPASKPPFVPPRSPANGTNPGDAPAKTGGSHSPAFIQKQHQRLLDLRDDLVDSMSGMTRDTIRNAPEGSEASGSGMHQGDAGSDAYDRDFALSVLAKEQDALYEIEQALRRIRNNTYGVCEISSKLIPQARLEAIPFARLTVECQAQWEKEYGNRRFRPSNEVGFSGGNQFDDEDSETVSLDEDEE